MATTYNLTENGTRIIWAEEGDVINIVGPDTDNVRIYTRDSSVVTNITINILGTATKAGGGDLRGLIVGKSIGANITLEAGADANDVTIQKQYGGRRDANGDDLSFHAEANSVAPKIFIGAQAGGSTVNISSDENVSWPHNVATVSVNEKFLGRANEKFVMNVDLGDGNKFTGPDGDGSGRPLLGMYNATPDNVNIDGLEASTNGLLKGFFIIGANGGNSAVGSGMTVSANNLILNGGQFRAGSDDDDIIEILDLVHIARDVDTSGTQDSRVAGILTGGGNDTLTMNHNFATNDADYRIFGDNGLTAVSRTEGDADQLNWIAFDEAALAEFTAAIIAAGGTLNEDGSYNTAGIEWSVDQQDGNGILTFGEWEIVTTDFEFDFDNESPFITPNIPILITEAIEIDITDELLALAFDADGDVLTITELTSLTDGVYMSLGEDGTAVATLSADYLNTTPALGFNSFELSFTVSDGTASASSDRQAFVIGQEGVEIIDIDNEIVGTEDADVLTGTSGADLIYGLGVGDTLLGNDGDDILVGGIGDDVLNGGSGDDELRGGLGSDVFVFETGAGSDTIIEFDLVNDTLDLTDFGLASADAARDLAESEDGNILFTMATGDTILFQDLSEIEVSAINILV